MFYCDTCQTADWTLCHCTVRTDALTLSLLRVDAAEEREAALRSRIDELEQVNASLMASVDWNGWRA